ncbi:hypothetical protein D3C72_1342690 [compost metagenome]
MKYFNTLLEEQETLINILYEEQVIRLYSNRIDVINNLTECLGKPSKKYIKSKTYWSGASWDINFTEFSKVQEILNSELIIDSNFKIKTKKIRKKDSSQSQFSFL